VVDCCCFDRQGRRFMSHPIWERNWSFVLESTSRSTSLVHAFPGLKRRRCGPALCWLKRSRSSNLKIYSGTRIKDKQTASKNLILRLLKSSDTLYIYINRKKLDVRNFL
jgi:hypothetical protein